jgi:hypothetical protein
MPTRLSGPWIPPSPRPRVALPANLSGQACSSSEGCDAFLDLGHQVRDRLPILIGAGKGLELIGLAPEVGQGPGDAQEPAGGSTSSLGGDDAAEEPHPLGNGAIGHGSLLAGQR